jgi:hypothetical protein
MARSSRPLMPAMTCPVFSSSREAIVPPVVIKQILFIWFPSRFVHEPFWSDRIFNSSAVQVDFA